MNSTGYAKLLDSIKTRVRAARLRAAAAVNVEVVLLYWHVGREILKRQDEQGWGTKVVDRLSRGNGPTNQLCNGCCTICPGAKTSSFWSG